MTYYVRFRDEEEYVVCSIDMKDAIDMATDMQKSYGKFGMDLDAVEAREVADDGSETNAPVAQG